MTSSARVDTENSARLRRSIDLLVAWLEAHEYKAYDPFDGLSASYLKPLTLNLKLPRQVLQQSVRRFPINMRPLLGIRPNHSSKGMGYIAKGCLRMYAVTREQEWADRAIFCLDWLADHTEPGYTGASWGNHFDYQSRNGAIPQGTPTVVWTSLIGHAFMDAYETFGRTEDLDVLKGIGEHILNDLGRVRDQSGEGVNIAYTPGEPGSACVHNSSVLGGSILARLWTISRDERHRSLATEAMKFTAKHQLPHGGWYYGVSPNTHWIDNFHTGYVLDCYKYYADATEDDSFVPIMLKGYEFWKANFFEKDGTPRYYDRKTLPLDIQCSSQAIDTLVLFSELDPQALELANRVADWTIRNMQDSSGYFYYRRYSSWLVNKTPTLHWGQATMLSALAGLYKEECTADS